MTGAPEGFERGALVRCVDARPWSITSPPVQYAGLLEGRIYTVRWVGQHSWESAGVEGLGIKLQEIIRPGEDGPFIASRFRPLRRLSVESFLKTKTDVPVGEDA